MLESNKRRRVAVEHESMSDLTDHSMEQVDEDEKKEITDIAKKQLSVETKWSQPPPPHSKYVPALRIMITK